MLPVCRQDKDFLEEEITQRAVPVPDTLEEDHHPVSTRGEVPWVEPCPSAKNRKRR